MNTNHDVSDATRKLVRLGLASKGAVYALIGILAIMPVLGAGQGGGTGGRKFAVQWLLEQSYGPYIVAIIALGLLFYAFWRLYRAFKNSPLYDDNKGKLKRVGYAASGIVYLIFAIYAGNLAIQSFSGGGGGGGSSSNSKGQIIQDLMQSTWGQVLLVIIGAALIFRSLYLIYNAYSGKYKEKVQSYSIDDKYKSYLIKSGKLGYLARGVVFSVIGYFFIKAVITQDSSQAAQGTGGALDFLQGSAGTIVMILVAAGLICYGIFMFLQARYRNVESII